MEAVVTHTPLQLRNHFAVLHTHINASDPLALWMEFKEDFAEDYMYQHQHLTTEKAAIMALIYIEDTVSSMGGPQLCEIELLKAS